MPIISLRAADEDVVATKLVMPLQQAVHLTFPALRLAHRTAGTLLPSLLTVRGLTNAGGHAYHWPARCG